ncbi:MAG TPA: T9SS type A sorting domain-containing protein, partial [Calditrichae bacterium]|nr:T9SS type A sorting domain-containing protein [Calditrichia bacterium]
LATARVEQYPAYSDPDALELVLSTPGDTIGRIQMNANREDNLPQTVLEQLDVPAGTYNLDLFAHITPTLYSIAAVGSKNATVLVADTTMETAPGDDSLTWKTYSFTTSGGRVAFYISGSADEDPQSNDYGSFDEANDDDLYLQLNDQMLNDSLAYFLDGNRLLGEGKTIFFVREMAAGTHTLSLITNNTPTKNAVIIIGEQGGKPVSLGHRIQQIPQQFRLKVFPNPFNQDVHLYFTSRSIRQPISVQIVNVNGQPVRKFQVLPRESVTNFRWDGTDNRGNVLPSGIYFVRATQGSYGATQKLVLIR